MTVERRFFSTKVELRFDSEGEDGVLVGRAAGYNRHSKDLGGFREILKPGCFKRTLASAQAGDVCCTFNHDPSLILGRVRSGNLTLKDMPDGLHFNCKLPHTSVAADVRQLVKDGIISECSFAFSVPDGGDDWSDQMLDLGDDDDDDRDGNGDLYSSRKTKCIVRCVTDADLYDVSVVSDPAYGGGATYTSARKLFPQGIPVSVRSHVSDNDAWLSHARAQRRNLVSKIIGQ